MRLLVDLGNSRLKWASSAAGQWRPGVAAYRGVEMDELLEQTWSELPLPQVAVMAAVAADADREALERWIEGRWRIPVHSVRARPELAGVVNRYRDPAALGPDRWAALIGARAELPEDAVCVVDCGTAVTVDALTADGQFAGGVIFPGLALLRESLKAGTAGLRAAEGNEASCLALSTADGIAAGTLYGLAGAIERVCGEFERALGEPAKLVMTGGDADHIAALLLRPALRVPDLVLKGLDRIADTL